MKKTRLEAFSDGVFAIVITLLILNVKLPEVQYNNLMPGLIDMLPTIGVYILSFLLIGMYWVFHHFALTLLSEVDGLLVWLNILFLLFVSFLPFPTMLLSKYPFQTIPIVIYASNLLLVNLTGFVFTVYLWRNKQLHSHILTSKIYKTQIQMYIGVNLLYIAGIIIAFFSPKTSVISFAVMTVFLIIRSAIFMGIGKCNLYSERSQ